MFKFNIGSAINGEDKALPLVKVHIRLWQAGFNNVRLVRTARSATESTYVVSAESFDTTLFDTHQEAVYAVSLKLDQDCIAYTAPDGSGHLVGPKSEDWGGVFNPDYFIV